MSLRIEAYGMIGAMENAALVGQDGSIDWLCLPRFDSDACFAALLGAAEHGRWVIRPTGELRLLARRYRPGTLVLETDLVGDGGAVRIIDFMPLAPGRHDVVRIVEGLEGEVSLDLELLVRFGYGAFLPWIQRDGDGTCWIGGPDALRLRCPVELEVRATDVRGRFDLRVGQRVPFVLSWHASHRPSPPPLDAEAALRDTERLWKEWSGRCAYQGPYREAVERSLITLRALTYRPTGGIVAAPTTSLPEEIGGIRNWDYRFCWLRDASITLRALMLTGYVEEAVAWRDWLLRTLAGDPAQAQILYGVAGERRLPEFEVPWLPGYEDSRPVRIGNAAADQWQLDVYGEVLDCAYQARVAGAPPVPQAWPLMWRTMELLEETWRRPDEGVWEVRGEPRHFTSSKMMAWVAADRTVRLVEQFEVGGEPVRQKLLPRWRTLRDQIHQDVCDQGFNPRIGAFTQSYGSDALDASMLLAPHFGFLPPDDPRHQGTVRAIERELTTDGLVRRYATETGADGLEGSEGVFLACSFWLADNYAFAGRLEEARELFERLLSLRNDLGLLAEEYDPIARRLLGNFPQGFSHVALVATAWVLEAQTRRLGR